MSESAGKPQIRFKGFTDAWEQRKLGDCAIYRRGSFPQPYGKKEWYGGKNSMPFVQVADVSSNMALVEMTKQMISEVAQPLSVFVPKNSVIVTLQGTIGRVALTQYDAYLDRTVLFFEKYNYQIESNFWAYLIKNKFEAEAKIAPGGTIKTITKEVLSNFELVLPQYSEQKRISTVLNDIDNLITLHQRKYEKLVNVKKSLLEKMFPCDGETTPKIRFKGFSDAWEQRKVTEVGKVAIGLVTTMTSHYTNEGCLLIRNSDIRDNHFEFDTNPIFLDIDFANQNSSRRHQIGDVITVHTGDVGTSAVIGEKEANSIGFATIITRPNKEIIDSNYLSCFLNTDKHKNWAVAISTGDGRTNYNLGDYVNLVVPVTSISEQQKLSGLFLNLNNLITLHQSKLEKLKNIKKSLLEKMFA